MANVLSGKTFYNTDAKTKQTGTMTNQSVQSASLNCGGSYTISAVYHNGSGKVIVSVANLSPTNFKKVFSDGSSAPWDGTRTLTGFTVGKIVIIDAYMVSTGSDRYIKVSSGMTPIYSTSNLVDGQGDYFFVGIATSFTIVLNTFGQNQVDIAGYLY